MQILFIRTALAIIQLERCLGGSREYIQRLSLNSNRNSYSESLYRKIELSRSELKSNILQKICSAQVKATEKL